MTTSNNSNLPHPDAETAFEAAGRAVLEIASDLGRGKSHGLARNRSNLPSHEPLSRLASGIVQEAHSDSEQRQRRRKPAGDHISGRLLRFRMRPVARRGEVGAVIANLGLSISCLQLHSFVRWRMVGRAGLLELTNERSSSHGAGNDATCSPDVESLGHDMGRSARVANGMSWKQKFAAVGIASLRNQANTDESGEQRRIPLYAEDGKTVIGTYVAMFGNPALAED